MLIWRSVNFQNDLRLLPVLLLLHSTTPCWEHTLPAIGATFINSWYKYTEITGTQINCNYIVVASVFIKFIYFLFGAVLQTKNGVI